MTSHAKELLDHNEAGNVVDELLKIANKEADQNRRNSRLLQKWIEKMMEKIDLTLSE